VKRLFSQAILAPVLGAPARLLARPSAAGYTADHRPTAGLATF